MTIIVTMIANKQTKKKKSNNHHMMKKKISNQNLMKKMVLISNMIFSIIIKKFKILELNKRKMHLMIFLIKEKKYFDFIKVKIGCK